MGISLGSWTVTQMPLSVIPVPSSLFRNCSPTCRPMYIQLYGELPVQFPIFHRWHSLLTVVKTFISPVGVAGLTLVNSGSCFDSKTSGTAGMPVTPDAIKSTTDGRDFYFFVMEKDATAQLYGSFFGQTGGEGDHVDGGTSRFDTRGAIYQAICANCWVTMPAPLLLLHNPCR